MKIFWKNLGQTNLHRLAMIAGILFVLMYYALIIIELF